MKIRIKSDFENFSSFENNYIEIDNLLVWATRNDCSDLFIKVGERPYVNRYGRIIPLNTQPITQIIWDSWFNENVSSEANAIYVRNKMYDTSYVVQGNRYRLNFSYSENCNILTARMINPIPPKFSEYGGKIDFPEGAKQCLKNAMSNKRGGGLILFAAPTGSGKSTTMACCINSWGNDNDCLRDSNFITLEDPIEYTYNSNSSFRIVQKELDKDFLSYDLGIKSSLREHPTHILVGETRDKDTIKALIEASRTGHITISTFHTRDIASTVTRLIDNFSDSLANGVDLISNIALIVCQRLSPKPDNSGYDLYVEYCSFNLEFKRILIDCLKTGESMEMAVNNYIDENIGNELICGRC